MTVLDVIDQGISLPFPEFRKLPPNRYRIRVGVGNRLLFNQIDFIRYGYNTWLRFLSDFVSLSGHIVDIGSGCGRTAYAVRDHAAFTGHYTGIDVDREMVAWCQKHFPPDRFTFLHADMFSRLYNPSGRKGPCRLPRPDASVDLVFSQSLFTHLLEADVMNYIAESHRILRRGKSMAMSVFCMEDMQRAGLLGDRWTFGHRVGNAYVENLEYPEAAVGYTREFLERITREAGFTRSEVLPRGSQSVLIGHK